jgi:Ca2+-binding RTX toxin-like protein
MLVVSAAGASSGNSITQFVNIVTGSTVFNGTSANDTLTGTGSSDFLGGGIGNDTIDAGAGNDRIFGGTGDDTIIGGAGRDVILGGVGSDTLTGGSESDVFKWSLADQGTAGSPSVDQITDFSTATLGAGGDALDLRDLLQGENGITNLENYLQFDTTSTPGSTVLHISTTGGFAGGTFVPGAEDQRIVFQNVADLGNSLGLGSSATDAQIIQDLITKGKLITD